MRWKSRVHRFNAQSPCDLSEMERAIGQGQLDAARIIAVLGKTEGNGCVNDFTRGYATQTVNASLATHAAAAGRAEQRAVVVMSGGTEGCLSPHWLVFEKLPDGDGAVRGDARDKGPRLAMAQATTRALLPEELGRAKHIQLVRDAVHEAMQDAGITCAADVHYVQVKCPLLTRQRIADALARGATTATDDAYESMAYSRGASALGVAAALHEVEMTGLEELGAAVCSNYGLYSERASASAGVELMHNEILVLGNSATWGGNLRIAHRVMADPIDLGAVQSVLGDLGFDATRQLAPPASARLVALLAKAEPSRSGSIRGARHTMLDDSDIAATRHARALVGGVLAAVAGDTRLFVSGGAEHQGPDGGGPVAAIAEVSGSSREAA